jgi:hypothetical protein
MTIAMSWIYNINIVTLLGIKEVTEELDLVKWGYIPEAKL